MPYGYQYGYQYGGTFFDPNVDREAIFRQIEGYVRLVNPDIAQISVRNDPLDNQLKLSANIIGETGTIHCPSGNVRRNYQMVGSYNGYTYS